MGGIHPGVIADHPGIGAANSGIKPTDPRMNANHPGMNPAKNRLFPVQCAPAASHHQGKPLCHAFCRDSSALTAPDHRAKKDAMHGVIQHAEPEQQQLEHRGPVGHRCERSTNAGRGAADLEKAGRADQCAEAVKIRSSRPPDSHRPGELQRGLGGFHGGIGDADGGHGGAHAAAGGSVVGEDAGHGGPGLGGRVRADAAAA